MEMSDYFLQHVEIYETLLDDDQRYTASTRAGSFAIWAYGSSIPEAAANLIVKVSEAKAHPSKHLPTEAAARYFSSRAIIE